MPFFGGIEETPNATLILSVAAAFLYLVIVNARPTPLRSAAKTMAVGLLAVLVFVQNGPPLLFGALVLSAFGDAFLSRDGERTFLAGLMSFLGAHLFYIALFVTRGGGTEVLFAEPWRLAVAAAIAVVAVAMLVLLWRRVKPRLRLLILVYALAIVAMALAALTLDQRWVVGGALLFLASDALLATERFLISAISPHRYWLRQGVWSLYYVAQVTITLSFLLRAGRLS
jgi:uncharacterized membrane protein YhhN